MRAKRAGKIKIELLRAKRAEKFGKFCTFPPNSSKFRSDYLFSFQERADYLFPVFLRSEYLFPKSASPPPPSESNGRPLKRCLNLDYRKFFYSGYVVPLINYCIVVWSNASKTTFYESINYKNMQQE